MSTTKHSVSSKSFIRINGEGPCGRILLDEETTAKLDHIAQQNKIGQARAFALIFGITSDKDELQPNRYGTGSTAISITGEALTQLEKITPVKNKGNFILNKIKSFVLSPPLQGHQIEQA